MDRKVRLSSLVFCLKTGLNVLNTEECIQLHSHPEFEPVVKDCK